MKQKHRYSPLICAVCMIAGCWIGIAYVLVLHGDRAAANATKPSTAETPVPAAETVNRWVDWDLTKILVEMDIRNPSPEHETFLREFDRTQKQYKRESNDY